jgi:DNA transformation protein and related proteins
MSATRAVRPGARRGGAAATDEPQFLSYVRDQLRRWAPVEIRRMFGGHGVFRGNTMFGLIHADALYLRTDDGNRGDFAAAGMAAFTYARGAKTVSLGYHEVPAEVIEDGENLAQWAARAFAAAERQAQKKSRTKRGG